MPPRAILTKADFLAGAAALIAESGPAAATVTAVIGRLGAPAGSFYHRFASRDELMGELWLELVEDFQSRFLALLGGGKPLKAALFTPHWCQKHPKQARTLLLYRREDFEEKGWPTEFQARAQAAGRALASGLAAFAGSLHGAAPAELMARTRFALVEAPLAAVKGCLARNAPVPASACDLVEETYRATLRPFLREK